MKKKSPVNQADQSGADGKDTGEMGCARGSVSPRRQPASETCVALQGPERECACDRRKGGKSRSPLLPAVFFEQ